MAGFHKMVVQISLSRLFWQVRSVRNFRTFTVPLISGLAARKPVFSICGHVRLNPICSATATTVMPAKSESDSDIMFCLQTYQGLIIGRSLY